MNIKTLAKHLQVDANDLLVEVEKLNRKYNLGINSYNLTRKQYNTVRCLIDSVFLVKLLNGDVKSDRKYDYTNAPDYIHIVEWISENNLNEASTAQIKQSLPDHITQRGHQLISAAMRAEGYVRRVVVLYTGKQGRRWFNDTPSFL